MLDRDLHDDCLRTLRAHDALLSDDEKRLLNIVAAGAAGFSPSTRGERTRARALIATMKSPPVAPSP
jgi:hypothetical protein